MITGLALVIPDGTRLVFPIGTGVVAGSGALGLLRQVSAMIGVRVTLGANDVTESDDGRRGQGADAGGWCRVLVGRTAAAVFDFRAVAGLLLLTGCVLMLRMGAEFESVGQV